MVEGTKVSVDGQIDLSGDGGVLKQVLREGTSEDSPTTGCKVSVHYTGTLTDGTKFDSSVDRDEPFEFDLDKGMVVKAFDIGIGSMKKGEKAVLTCKPEYAYGAAGSPPNIPPQATLLFEVELLDWKVEDLSPKKNGGILRHVIQKGTGKKSPNANALLNVHLIGKYEGKVFDDRELSFNVGEVPHSEVISGVQIALTHFHKGETSRLTIAAEHAFGTKGNAKFGIPPNATVEYEVSLNDFEKEPDAWKLTPEESLQQAKLIKEKATAFLKQEEYELAIKLYDKCVILLSNCKDEESQKVKAAVWSNSGLCQLKLKNWLEVRRACGEVLEIEPENVKAFYRRGLAYLSAGDPDTALKDFNKVHELDAENKAALNQIAICNKEIKDYNDRQKKLYANMFGKFASADKKKEAVPNSMTFDACGEWKQEEDKRSEKEREIEEMNKNVVML